MPVKCRHFFFTKIDAKNIFSGERRRRELKKFHGCDDLPMTNLKMNKRHRVWWWVEKSVEYFGHLPPGYKKVWNISVIHPPVTPPEPIGGVTTLHISVIYPPCNPPWTHRWCERDPDALFDSHLPKKIWGGLQGGAIKIKSKSHQKKWSIFHTLPSRMVAGKKIWGGSLNKCFFFWDQVSKVEAKV